MVWLTVGYCVMHRKYNNGRWVVQGAEPMFLPNLVCDQICQPSNEDEDEMKQTDPTMMKKYQPQQRDSWFYQWEPVKP